jgi:uncharacterized membrane protein YccC
MHPWRALRTRDPNWFVLRRSVRAAVVVPVNFAIGSQLVGDAQVATFAAFGSFALLVFVNFPGGRAARTASYGVLGVAGVALISLGSVLASPDWLAVVAMLVVAFGVLFAGVLSSVINAGSQAALLSFILAVMLPGGRAALPDRLAGWGIAIGVSVPVAVLIWPPSDRDVLRLKAAAVCRALAQMLHLEQPAPGEGDSFVAMRRAAAELRTAFRTAATRVAAVSTGSRLLIRLVDELEWLATAVANACADAPEGWSELGQRMRDVAARVLEACAMTLQHDDPHERAHGVLNECMASLEVARRAVSDEALAGLLATTAAKPAGSGTDTVVAGEFDRPLYAAHELGYAVRVVAGTVSGIARADSRPWWARVLGRRLDMDEVGALAGAQRSATGHFDLHSVWLHNSVRGAVGLAVAVGLARGFDAQNAFWIGLGALSVLRSNALSTGSTALRALSGTLLGFVIGGAAVYLIGTNHAVLWTLLPPIIVVAASAPVITSFIVGQAGFTMFTIVLFNIVAPAGWRIGVTRIEDVALGCLASLVAGVLFWPRGAGAALGTAFAESYRSSAELLRESVDSLVHGRPKPAGERATAAGSRLDDALRQYLAERGTKHVPLESVATLANGATRLRLAGAAIAELNQAVPLAVDGTDEPAAVLNRRAEEVTCWYTALADGFTGRPGELPTLTPPTDSFLDVVLPALNGCGESDRAARAETLLWSGQYLGDVDRLRTDLVGPAEMVNAARAMAWWRR